jgi:hypothetical protein
VQRRAETVTERTYYSGPCATTAQPGDILGSTYEERWRLYRGGLSIHTA